MDVWRQELEELPLWGKIVTGVVAVATPVAAYMYFRKQPRKSPVTENWKRDVVYLYQFPPAATVPNISPYCLKVETWLRMTKIPYENVPCKVSLRSKEGMLPFVELNGTELYDSSFIIRDLAKHFNKKENITAAQAGAARAFEQMMEFNTSFSYAQIRYVEKSHELLSEKVLGVKLPLLFQLFMPARMMRNSMRSKLFNHGIGRHTRDEVVAIGLDDLRAISDYLGDKKYMNGDEPTRVDATLFGHLVQILYVPLDSPHKDLLREECTNVVQYCNRIRDDFWPDWYSLREKRPFMW
jgi:glutathione S-transferase